MSEALRGTSLNPAQAAAKTNDTAGDGTTTATILSAAIIAEGMKIVAAGANPVQVRRPARCEVLHAAGQQQMQLSEAACSQLILAHVRLWVVLVCTRCHSQVMPA